MKHKKLLISALISGALFALWIFFYANFGFTCEPGVPCSPSYWHAIKTSWILLPILFAVIAGITYLVNKYRHTY